jgi:alanine racemase
MTIFSHFSASANPKERDYTEGQYNLFIKISEEFKKVFGFLPKRHLCSSAGLINYKKYHFDFVRSAIILIGYGYSKESNEKLIPISAFKSIISMTRVLKKGDTCGYNRCYRATREEEKIAIVPVGYVEAMGR